MNKQEIIEGNKLIAEFMGRCGKVNKNLFWVNIPGVLWVTTDEMKFNSSWDWLMPVIQKMFYMPFGDTPGLSDYFDKHMDEYSFGFHCPIKVVFNKVVEFIKWYNQQKIKNHVSIPRPN